jgi:hypothetical protein
VASRQPPPYQNAPDHYFAFSRAELPSFPLHYQTPLLISPTLIVDMKSLPQPLTRILSTPLYVLRQIYSRPRLIVTLFAIFFGPRLIRKLYCLEEWLLAPWGSRLAFILARTRWPYFKSDQTRRGTLLYTSEYNAQIYIYMPLIESRQLRLLEVAYKDHPKNFTCRLVPTSLDAVPVDYLAISYYWGDPSVFSRVMFTDGTFMGITNSVSIILEALYKSNCSIYI